MRRTALAAVVLLATVAGPVVAGPAPAGDEPAARAPGATNGAAQATDVDHRAVPDPTRARAPAGADWTAAPVGTTSAMAGRPSDATTPAAPAGDDTVLAGQTDAVATAARASAPPDRRTVTAKNEPAVTVAHEMNLTPDRPGEVRVTLRPRVPDGTSTVSVGLSERATVVSSTGFARNEARYRANVSASNATLTYRLPVNVSAPGGELEAVDAGAWALVRTPSPSLEAADADVQRRYTVDGEGVVGQGLAYLGPHETYTRAVDGERIELVVPAAAEMRSRPTAVMDSLESAARTTAFGGDEDAVLFVAAPTTVDWAYAAQQVGASDAWVQADQRLRSPRNAWLHEYVHTRQAFRTTRETRWLVEGTATYYAAVLSLRQGLVDFEQFREHLQVGTTERNREAVLADPATWTANRAEYRKGALVVGALDRRIRASSDGWRSFQWVLRRLNGRDGRIEQVTFAEIVESAGGARVRVAAGRFTTNPTAPEPWTSGVHRTTFGWTPPRVSTDIAGLSAAGPGGRRLLTGDLGDVEEVVVTTDERLVAAVHGSNDGGRPASFAAPMAVNFTGVNRTVAEVPGGETATARVSYDFPAAGTYHVTVAGETVRVRVVEPARSVRVTEFSVTPGDADSKGEVTVVTRVRNSKDRPAQVTLPVSVDGRVVTTRTVSVGAHATRRVATNLALNDSGQYRVVVASEGANVTVTSSGHVVVSGTSTPAPTEEGLLSPSSPGGSGLGLLGALMLVALGASVARRRW
jgi:hypothetical protein